MIERCPWCGDDLVYLDYHDNEWGVPQRDSRKLFEALILDGAQAGLSWITILKRREGYRTAFEGFDPRKIAAYTEKDVERLVADARIIRNRRKILSAIENANAFCAMEDAGVDFSAWLWDFVDNEPIIHHYKTIAEIPATTELSDMVSSTLRDLGFTFVGSTIVYAFMQACGLVNDHLVTCFRHPEYQG